MIESVYINSYTETDGPPSEPVLGIAQTKDEIFLTICRVSDTNTARSFEIKEQISVHVTELLQALSLVNTSSVLPTELERRRERNNDG